MPIALEPPPTHATTVSGSRPGPLVKVACAYSPPLVGLSSCARASCPITACRSRTMSGKGCGPTAEPMM